MIVFLVATFAQALLPVKLISEAQTTRMACATVCMCQRPSSCTSKWQCKLQQGNTVTLLQI